MIVTKIDRIKDVFGRETNEAYVSFDGQEAIKVNFPSLPEKCEVTEQFGQYYISGIGESGMDEGVFQHAKSHCEFFNKVCDFIEYRDIKHFCDNFDVLTMLRKNPYFLSEIELDEDGRTAASFSDVDAHFGPNTFENRLKEFRYAAREVLKRNETEGHTWMPYNQFDKQVRKLLARNGHNISDKHQTSAILRYFEEFYLDRKLTPSAKVALTDTRNTEYNIYNEIVAQEKAASQYANFHLLDRTGLSDEQANAVEGAIAERGRVSIITGGPGTGKTTVLRKIVNTMKTLYPLVKIALLAPTGKASKRIRETMCGEADKIATVHKYLYWDPSQTNRAASMRAKRIKDEEGNAISPLEEIRQYGLIIIDESSMLDIEVFWELLANINLANTKLVLVGDANQLPSVKAGNLLHDFIELGVPTFRLTKNFRNAGLIAENAKRIINGELFLDEGNDFQVISTTSTGWKLAAAFASINADEDYVTISPYRKDTQEGASSKINEQVQTSLFGGNGMKCGKFFRGDRVIFTKNDTSKNASYFNGETGTLFAYSQGMYSVDVDGHTVECEGDVLDLAYSITIHKSQGSEYETVAIVLPKGSKFVTRRMLYTAVTRAKSKVVIYGSRESIRCAIANNNDEERRTFLRYNAEIQKMLKEA